MIEEVWDAGASAFRLRTEDLERIRYRPYGFAERKLLADTNGDGSVALAELNAVLAAFGDGIGTGGYAAELDTNADGVVNLTDKNAVLGNFGTSAPTDGSLWDAAPGMVGFGAGLYDEVAGLYLFRNRYYDPYEGRWITRDPAGYVDGMSLYQYVQGNPLMYFDPFGLGRVRTLLKTLGFAGGYGGAKAINSAAGMDVVSPTRTAMATQRGVSAAISAVDENDGAIRAAMSSAGPASVLVPTPSEALNDLDRRVDRVEVLAETGGGSVGDYVMSAAAEVVGANALSEGIVGVDVVDQREIHGLERGLKLVEGGTQMAGTAAGATGLGTGASMLTRRVDNVVVDQLDDIATAAPRFGPETYARPTHWRKNFRENVWEANRGPDGTVRDPLTGTPMSPADPWDMGHRPGFEFRKHARSAYDRQISRKEFLDEHFTESHFRPELRRSNRSHECELTDDEYYGP